MQKEIHVKNEIVAHRYPGEDASYALVISHGIAGHGGVYNRFCEPHANRGVDIWAYDAPGHGQSTPLQARGQWTLTEWVDAAIMYAEHVKDLTGLPVFAMGSSLGGAAAFSSLQSDAVSGGIMMGTPVIPGSPLVNAMAGPWRDPAVAQMLESLGRAARMDIGLFFDFDKDYGFPGAAANLRLDPWTTWDYDLASWASVFQYDPPSPPADNTKPVLLSSGEDDPVATPEVIQGVADTIGGPVDVICMENATHQLMQFHTEAYSDLVHEWVLKQI